MKDSNHQLSSGAPLLTRVLCDIISLKIFSAERILNFRRSLPIQTPFSNVLFSLLSNVFKLYFVMTRRIVMEKCFFYQFFGVNLEAGNA